MYYDIPSVLDWSIQCKTGAMLLIFCGIIVSLIVGMTAGMPQTKTEKIFKMSFLVIIWAAAIILVLIGF